MLQCHVATKQNIYKQFQSFAALVFSPNRFFCQSSILLETKSPYRFMLSFSLLFLFFFPNLCVLHRSVYRSNENNDLSIQNLLNEIDNSVKDKQRIDHVLFQGDNSRSGGQPEGPNLVEVGATLSVVSPSGTAGPGQTIVVNIPELKDGITNNIKTWLLVIAICVALCLLYVFVNA